MNIVVYRFWQIALLLVWAFFLPFACAAPAYSISDSVYDAIDSSSLHIEKGEYTEAENILNRVRKRGTLNTYERAAISQQLGAIDFERDDYQSAQMRFEQFLHADGLPQAFLLQLHINLAQTYILRRRDAAAVALLRPLLDADTIPPEAFFVIAAALRNLGNNEDALRFAERGLKRTAEPGETEYATILSLYLALEDYRNAQHVLEQILERYPAKPIYWRQALWVAIRLDDRMRAMTLGDMGYKLGTLRSGEDILYLVKLYLDRGVPHKAARLLSKALAAATVAQTAANWHLLSLAWTDAREFDRAIGPLRKAAELSDHGRFYARLGSLHMEQRRWDDAVRMFAYAIDKGRLEQPHKVRLLHGIALVESGRNGEAEQEFAYCLGHASTYKDASEWLKFLGTAVR